MTVRARCVCVCAYVHVSVFECVCSRSVNLHQCDSFLYIFLFYRACMSHSHCRVGELADHADVSGVRAFLHTFSGPLALLCSNVSFCIFSL